MKNQHNASNKKEGSKRFSSNEYVNAYIESGILPAIHEDIGVLLDNFLKEDEVVIDLGSCTGLLSLRAIKAGAKLVFGIEPNLHYISEAVVNEKIKYENFPVIEENFEKLFDIITKNNVTSIIARRVFPEIGEAGSVGTVYELAKLFYNNGINHIYLEGRVFVKNAKNHFSCVEREIEAFELYYEKKAAYKNAYILQKRINKIT